MMCVYSSGYLVLCRADCDGMLAIRAYRSTLGSTSITPPLARRQLKRQLLGHVSPVTVDAAHVASR